MFKNVSLQTRRSFDQKSIQSLRTQRVIQKAKNVPVKADSAEKQIKELEITHQKLKIQRDSLKRREALLKGALVSISMRKEIFRDFESQIGYLTDRIQNRHERLKRYAESIKKFSSMYINDSDIIELHRDLKILHEKSKTLGQKDLIDLNRTLSEKALDQERLLLFLKMRLRHCHDHRDLSELQSVLNSIMGGGKNEREDDAIIGKLRDMIMRLKDQIKREHNRIAMFDKPYNETQESALLIQSTWRMYKTKRQFQEIRRQYLESKKKGVEMKESV